MYTQNSHHILLLNIVQPRHCRLSPAHKLKGLCFQQSLFDANQQLEVIVLTIGIPRPLNALVKKCANMPEVYAILSNKTTLKCTRKNTVTCFKTTGKQKCVATEGRSTSCDMPSDSTQKKQGNKEKCQDNDKNLLQSGIIWSGQEHDI